MKNYFLVAFLCFLVTINGQDACERLQFSAQNVLVNARPSDMLACFQQVPFDRNAATELISILRQAATLYSSTEYACGNFPPFNTQLCLDDEITRIEAKVNDLANSYANDYDFHLDVADSFRKLNDAHTLYTPPAGFSGCQIGRSFVVDLNLNKGIFKSAFGLTSQFDNLEVVSIDGLAPVDYFKEKAETIGIFRDFNVRFNHALGSFAFESVDFTHFNTISDTEKVVILNGGVTTELTFEKNITCLGDRRTVQQVTARNNPPNNRRSLIPEIERLEPRPDLYKDPLLKLRIQRNATRGEPNRLLAHKEIELKTLPLPKSRKIDLRAASIVPPRVGNVNALQVVVSTSDFSFIYFRYNNIPVWKILTFFPADANEVLAAILTAIDDSKARGDTSLFIDLAGNGGGIVCLSLALSSLLVRDWAGLPVLGNSVPWHFVDVKKNAFMDAWLDTIVVDSVFDPANGNFLLEKDWYNQDTIQKQIGALSADFTKKGYWPGSCAAVQLPPVDYFFNSIFLITDGTCGSACSQFESKIQEENGVFVMTYGGFEGGIPDTSSFAGGNVLDWTSFLVGATASTNQPAPPLPTSATLSFNHHINYQQQNDLLPREFIKLDSDIHAFLHTPLLLNSLDPNQATQALADVYETAVQGFGVVPPPGSAFAYTPSFLMVLIAIFAMLF